MRKFCCPVEIVTGEGALERLGQCRAERVLLVADPWFVQSGQAAQIGEKIPHARLELFDEVCPDPPAELAARGAALCKKLQPDLLVALGGGSALDLAKAIRLAAELPMTFCAIPTTSGSGSEVTAFSVLTRDGVKVPLVDRSLRPDLAILDPALLEALPPTLIADTGMDVLTHSLEALAAKNRSSFTDALALEAAAAILQHLRQSYEGDSSVRGLLHEASAMAGLAFDQAGLGLCHALAHSLGGRFHLPHGRLCAMVLPHVMDYNRPAVLPQYVRLARICGLAGAADSLTFRSLCREVAALRRSLHLPGTLAEAGIAPAEVRESREQLAAAVLADPCLASNPVPVTREAVFGLLEAVSG